MHKNLPTVEGLKTRFLCSISADEGTNTTLAGYVKVGGESLPMTAGGENELVAPATPAGDYLYELRAGGAVVLWGHLCARPSAFPPVEDATAIEVAATITGETAIAVSITLKEGPQGPKGDTGATGPQGPKGDPGSMPTLDAKPTSGSTNGVTSGGIYDADLHISLGTGSMAVGKNAVANNAYSVAMGEGAVTGGYYNPPTATLTIVSENRTGTNASTYPASSTAVGFHATCSKGACVAFGAYAKAGGQNSTSSGSYATASGTGATASGSYSTASGSYATASGSGATASGNNSRASGVDARARGSYATASGAGSTASGSGATAIGAGCYVADDGVLALNAGGAGYDENGNDLTYSDGKSTQLYLIGEGTALADAYTGGEAGLGYVVLDHLAGKIVARGCCKLSAICTEHTTDFTPLYCENISDY